MNVKGLILNNLYGTFWQLEMVLQRAIGLVLTIFLTVGLAGTALGETALRKGLYSPIPETSKFMRDPARCEITDMWDVTPEEVKKWVVGTPCTSTSRKTPSGFDLTLTCPDSGPDEKAPPWTNQYRLKPVNESEFDMILAFEPDFSKTHVTRYKWCDVDVASHESKGAVARFDGTPRQQPKVAEVATCEAISQMGMPEAFARERIRVHRTGSSVFGSAGYQQFFGELFGGPVYYGAEREKRKAEIEQKQKAAEIRADSYVTRPFGDLVCGAASRGVQLTFKTGLFSSKPRQLVASSKSGRSVSFDLKSADDGPDQARRWFATSLNANGKTASLEREAGEVVLLCLISSPAEETIAGLSSVIMEVSSRMNLVRRPQSVVRQPATLSCL